MTRAKYLVVGALLLAAAPAFAQDATPAAPAPPPAGSTTAGAPAIPPGTDTGPMIDRSLTLSAPGRIGAYGDFDYGGSSESATVGTTTISESVSTLSLHGGLAYGVNPELTVGLDYALPMYVSASFMGMSQSNSFPNNGEGPIALYGDYQVTNSGPLSVYVTGAFIANFNAGSISDGMGNTSTLSDYDLSLGASVRYKVTPQINVFTGQPIPMGILGSQLDIPLNNSREISFGIPVGAGYQATPQIYAYIDTTLATFLLSNVPMGGKSSEIIFADVTPLAVGGFYALNAQMDVGAQLSFGDLGNAGDTYGIGVAARWHQ